MQDPNVLLTILSQMAQKPEVINEATKSYGKIGEPDTLNGVRPVRRGVQ